MSRILRVHNCDSCPCRISKESHGGCDSSYWDECSITKETIYDQDNWEKSKWSNTASFPPSCPLEK